MGSIRVMSFNVRGDYNEGIRSWKQRAPVCIELIQDLAPDVVGFQELQPTHYTSLQRDLTGYTIELGLPYDYEEHPSIAWKANRLEKQESGYFWLSETPEEFSRGWDAACVRSLFWIRFRVKRSGRSILFLNTHLDHVGKQARLESARQIVKRVKTIRRKEEPVILTLDLNDEPGSPAYRHIVQQEFLDCFIESGGQDGPELFTFHGFVGQPQPEGRRIDHIFLSPGESRMLPSEVRIPTYCRKEKDSQTGLEECCYPSDHYPVVVDIDFDE